MNEHEFFNKIRENIKPNDVFPNPGGGMTTIRSITRKNIYYCRGSSTINLPISEFFKAYNYFRGKKCATSDLKKFLPSVFDSKARPAGHSCNCTFFFSLLQRLELCSDCRGRGVAGDPFWVEIY